VRGRFNDRSSGVDSYGTPLAEIPLIVMADHMTEVAAQRWARLVRSARHETLEGSCVSGSNRRNSCIAGGDPAPRRDNLFLATPRDGLEGRWLRCPSDLRRSRLHLAHQLLTYLDFAVIVEPWTGLPGAVTSGFLTMVQASTTEGREFSESLTRGYRRPENARLGRRGSEARPVVLEGTRRLQPGPKEATLLPNIVR
jgi:hypothetical protein